MTAILRLGASSLAALLSVAPSFAGELLTNGGFESEPNFGAGVSNDPGYSALTGAQIPGWTIERGHAATVHNTVLYPTISGGFSINMDGEGFNGVNANLYQDFASAACLNYQLSFDWQGWFNNGTPTLDVSVVDTVTNAELAHGVYSYDAALHHETFTFAGTGHALRLRIREGTESHFNDNVFIVDNFSVVSTSPAIVGDLNGDCAVNGADLAILLGAWQTAGADLNGDGTTNSVDLAILLGAWTG